MTDNREQGVTAKTTTDFGSLHFTVIHDETNRVKSIAYATHDSDLTDDTQIGKLLMQCMKAINGAITAMNEDWSHKWDLAAIAKRKAGEQ